MSTVRATIHVAAFVLQTSSASSTSDTFSTGLVNMANYLGNIILPISAGLVVAIGLYAYSASRGWAALHCWWIGMLAGIRVCA